MRPLSFALLASVLGLSACTSNSSNSPCDTLWRTSDDYFIAGRTALARAAANLSQTLFVVGTASDPAATAIVRQRLPNDFLWTTAKTYTDRSLVTTVANTARIFAAGKFAAGGGWAVSASSDGSVWTDLASGHPTGSALKSAISGDYVVFIGEQNATDVILSQRMVAGLSTLENAVTVGNGRPADFWSNSEGELFLLVNDEGGADATMYTSTDNGGSWSAGAVTIPVQSATKAAMGGFLDQVYFSWADANTWNVGVANALISGLTTTRAVYPLSSGFSGFANVVLSARSDEVLLAGDTSSTGVAKRWQTVLTRPITTGTPTVDTYSRSSNATAQVLGGTVFDTDYYLVGTALDENGDGHWITRQLTCN